MFRPFLTILQQHFSCMLYDLPDDGQKLPKLAVDDNELCSIVHVVFILDNKQRKRFHIHTI